MSFDITQLNNPKAFDALRMVDEAFESLAGLGKTNLSHIQACRYAQYLLYRQRDAEAEQTLELAGYLGSSALLNGLRFTLLSVSDRFAELEDKLTSFRAQGASPLELEGHILAYEAAAYYYLYKEDFYQAYASLHKAEGFALALNLNYRLGVIRNNLEAVAAAANDGLPLGSLTAGSSGLAADHSVRTRFLYHLTRAELKDIKTLLYQGRVSYADYRLAEATKHYETYISKGSGAALAASLVTENLPEHPESKLYWCFLMLQLFSVLGAAKGLSNPERIQKVLKRCVGELDHPTAIAIVVARVYPLGLSLAARLEPRLETAAERVALLCNVNYSDGIHIDGDVVTVTKPVRSALILDELSASRENFTQVIKRPHGHPTNKARWQRSLEKARLSRSEFVSVGGVYRGLVQLADTLGYEPLQREAQAFALQHRLPKIPDHSLIA